MNRFIILFKLLTILLLAGTGGLLPSALHAAGPNEGQQQPVIAQRSFASPEEAIKVLQAATEAKDKAAFDEIFGPQVRELLTGDKVQDANNAQSFSAVMAQGHTLVNEGVDKIIIEVGPNNWPMPIPLVKVNGRWYFDTAAGKEEIINRHIGKDELHAIGVCRAYVTEQQQYVSINPDASTGVKYAQKFKGMGPQPFHGYFFRILTRQGKDAPGGRMNYMSHGNLTGGFALVAYPVHWGRSGVMTFIVNQKAQVFQRNFGEKTFRIAGTMKEYNPDNGWSLVQDEGDAVSEK